VLALLLIGTYFTKLRLPDRMVLLWVIRALAFGAIIVTAHAEGVALVVGLVAIVLATVNMVGGFVVTDRMLQMFTRRKVPAKSSGTTAGGGAA